MKRKYKGETERNKDVQNNEETAIYNYRVSVCARERENEREPWVVYLTLEQVTLPLWMLIAGCVK